METNEKTAPAAQQGVSIPVETQPAPVAAAGVQQPTKFCSHCGGKIHEKAVICPLCGCQVEQMAGAQQPNIVINNSNTNTNTNVNQNVAPWMMRRPKSKWTAFFLCLFLGLIGVHKFYEGKVGMGILYIFTLGLFGIGVLVDLIVLLFKPNPYYV